MKARSLVCMLALVGLLVVGSSRAEDEKDPLAGIKCPISGKPVVAESATDYKEGKVYFCCTNCPKGFAANTEKFAAKANMQLVSTGQYTQKVCPLTGKPSKDDKVVDVDGVSVQVCCAGCLGKAEKSDDKVTLFFNDKAFEKGFEKAAAE